MTENIEDCLAVQGFYVSTTVGMSMWPLLKNRRDRIVIRPVGDRELRRGDVPLYRRPDGKYVLHRILRVKEDHFVIRGDNTYALERVPKEWVIGYLAEFYRKGKHVTCLGFLNGKFRNKKKSGSRFLWRRTIDELGCGKRVGKICPFRRKRA